MADNIYNRFDELRENKGVTVYAVSKATGITTTTFTNWKKGKYIPKQDKLQLIADYFKVSVDYLMNGKEPEFSIEMAETDVALTNMEKRVKEYALKLAALSEKDKEMIMQMIDRCEIK